MAKQKKHKEAFAHVHMQAPEDEASSASVREDDRAIDEGLRAIYDGNSEDLHVVTQAGGGITRVLVRIIGMLLVLVLLGAGAVAGYTWYIAQQTHATDALRVAIQSPQEIKSGEEVTLEIVYENPRNIALAQLALDVNLPEGFVPKEFVPEPTNADELVWNMGSLGQRSDGKIVLTGTWYADVPASERIQVISTYRPANTQADFSLISSAYVEMAGSVLDLAVTGPAEITAGEQARYEATFLNTGTTTLTHAQAAFVLPTGFVPTLWEPALTAGEGTVAQLPSIAPGEIITQSVTGTFASEVHDLQEMVFSASLQPAEGERMFLQERVSWFTNVEGARVSVILAGNGSTGSVAVAPGDHLRLSVQLANTSDASMNDIGMLLDFQPEQGVPITWSASTLGKAKVTAAGVVMTPENVGALAAGERKTFSFIFPIKSEITADMLSHFTVYGRVTSGGKTVQSIPLEVVINADVALSGEARYFAEDGAPLGQGAFPPRVGEETVFLVSWTVTRALHALDDVSVSATLPPDVRFISSRHTDLGSLVYSEDTRTLTWTIAQMASESTQAIARFELGMTPGEEDVDTYAKLLSGSVLRASDEETGNIVTAEVGALTTELVGDSVANARGIVADAS